MKRLMDIHTHAVASGHAYSTVDENLRWAAEQGLQLVALTDHAPAMKDTTCHAYFANLRLQACTCPALSPARKRRIHRCF